MGSLCWACMCCFRSTALHLRCIFTPESCASTKTACFIYKKKVPADFPILIFPMFPYRPSHLNHMITKTSREHFLTWTSNLSLWETMWQTQINVACSTHNSILCRKTKRKESPQFSSSQINNIKLLCFHFFCKKYYTNLNQQHIMFRSNTYSVRTFHAWFKLPAYKNCTSWSVLPINVLCVLIVIVSIS